MPDTSENTTNANERFREAREYARSARSSLRKSLEEMIPPGFTEHRRAARKEALLAVRSLVDAAIERSEKRTTN
jgi:hypothetical protein